MDEGEKILDDAEVMKDGKKPIKVLLIGDPGLRSYQLEAMRVILADKSGIDAQVIDEVEFMLGRTAVVTDSILTIRRDALATTLKEAVAPALMLSEDPKPGKDYVHDYVVMGGRRVGKHDQMARIKLKNMKKR